MGIPPRRTSVARTSTEENNTKQVNITRKKKLFLLFYTTENKRGDNLMYYSALTRRQNIEYSTWFDKDEHLIFSVPIQDIAEIITTVSSSIQKRGGIGKVEIKEVSIFSHSWYDGPTGSAACSVFPESLKQMKLEGWKSISFVWATKARFVMFGCNSATDDKGARIFAKELSQCPNFNNVEVWGQTGPAKPSLRPDKRDSTVLRNMNTGWAGSPTYMVAGKDGDGKAATRGYPSAYPPALPMKKYINGVLIAKIFQNEFNDHMSRKYIPEPYRK